ncbi:MAG: hypothetical protein JSW27_01630 [Phycisphaerales bacterium]|nr:MAG: hypothetical protein JSW27_01630 [Phycisphaerales bacterium]
MRKVVILIAVVVLLALGVAVGPGRSEEAHQREGRGIEVLDRNIRLTFEMVDEEGRGHEPVSIVTAVPKYKLKARFEWADQHVAVSIVGAAGPRNDGHILALLEAEILFADDEEEVELAVECGVLLEPGQAEEIARWGKRALVVHAEHAD